MSGARIKIGLVGLGEIAVRAHLPTILNEPRAELVTVCDIDPARIAALSLEGPRTSTDPYSLFADETLEAVVIATPPDATAALTRAALKAGKYVLAEKPLGLSMAEAVTVAEVAGARERLQIGLTYRHHPAIERLRDLIAANELGRPLMIQNTISDEPADPHDEAAYRRRLRSLERNPPIISDGVHACDRLNFLLDSTPEQIVGWSLRSNPEYASANVTGGVLTYPDGTLVRLEVIWLYPVLPPGQLVVTGPDGCARVEPATFDLQVTFRDGRAERVEPPGDKTAVCFAIQFERFVDHCLAGTAPEPGIDAAIASLELAERIADASGARLRGAA
ncbi:MAG: Gfo/Idh/MocA family oxidoreductase [Myxococcales bacterium]|nr:Gfo/Idh/MocA family oxidoreductase [Thermoleophilia bacterium]MDH4281025.1 Gfo/Idh/MocA family oxidoreductase [Myxococcales bacterium]